MRQTNGPLIKLILQKSQKNATFDPGGYILAEEHSNKSEKRNFCPWRVHSSGGTFKKVETTQLLPPEGTLQHQTNWESNQTNWKNIKLKISLMAPPSN